MMTLKTSSKRNLSEKRIIPGMLSKSTLTEHEAEKIGHSIKGEIAKRFRKKFDNA